MSRAKPERWRELKKAYLLGEGSLRELAKRFGLGEGAVMSRCARENWRGEVLKTEQDLASRVASELQSKASTIAEKAAYALERTFAEGVGWLDDVQIAKTKLQPGDVYGMLQLLRAWQIPTSEIRKAVAPDGNQGPKVTVGVYSTGDCIRGVKADIDA